VRQAVFISYASEDVVAAGRICDAWDQLTEAMLGLMTLHFCCRCARIKIDIFLNERVSFIARCSWQAGDINIAKRCLLSWIWMNVRRLPSNLNPCGPLGKGVEQRGQDLGIASPAALRNMKGMVGLRHP